MLKTEDAVLDSVASKDFEAWLAANQALSEAHEALERAKTVHEEAMEAESRARQVFVADLWPDAPGRCQEKYVVCAEGGLYKVSCDGGWSYIERLGALLKDR